MRGLVFLPPADTKDMTTQICGSVLWITLLLGGGQLALAEAQGCECSCEAKPITHSSEQVEQAQKMSQLETGQASVSQEQLKSALSILQRACAQRNDCTAEEELQAVEKILFGVASSVVKDDDNFLTYLKSRISLGLRVLTGSYDVSE